jgi:hypothetical protein
MEKDRKDRKDRKNNKFKKHIHFGGSCGLYHYQLGITSVIIDKFGDKLDDVFITGVSGGALSKMLLSLNTNNMKIDIDDYVNNVTKDIIKDVNQHITGSLFNYLYYSKIHAKKSIQQFIDTSKEEEDNQNNQKHIINTLNSNSGLFITQHTKGSQFNPYNYKTKLITEWNDETDYLDCFMSSSFIPIFWRFKLTDYYQNKRTIDGCCFYIDKQLEQIKETYECKQLLITIHIWRTFNWWEYWPSSSFNKHLEYYLLGKADALKNIKQLESFFD